RHPGNFLVVDGQVFYSPNCKRVVEVPAAINTDKSNLNPFQPGVRWEDLRNPCRWSRAYGWASFIPLDRLFGAYPFNEVAFIPQLELDPESELYSHTVKIIDMWSELDAGLHQVASVLFSKYDAPAVFPYSIRGWKFQTKFRSLGKGRALTYAARDWLLVWMGLLSFLIAYAESRCEEFEKFREDHSQEEIAKLSRIKHWQEALNPTAYPAIQYLTESLPLSAVCSFLPSTRRCGIFLDLTNKAEFQPSVTWFIERGVPVWFPWTADTPQYLAKLNMSHLIPPAHVLQKQSQTILTRLSLPIPALLAQRKSAPAIDYRKQQQESEEKARVDGRCQRVAADNRARKPPTTSAQVHLYESDVDNPAKLKLEVVSKAQRGETLGSHTDNQSRYFPEFNIWVCCVDMAPDEAADDDEDNDLEWYFNPQGQSELVQHIPLRSTQTFPSASLYLPDDIIPPADFTDTFMGEGGCDRLEHAICQDMKMFYGFVAPIPYPTGKPASQKTEQDMNSFLRAVGFEQKSAATRAFFDLGISDAIFNFYHVCIHATETSHPSPESWDILPESFSPPANASILDGLSFVAYHAKSLGATTQPKQGKQRFWLILELSPSHPWRLALRTAADLVTICRFHPSSTPNKIVTFLVQRGIPFQTLQAVDTPPRHVPYHPTPNQLPRKPQNHIFTVDDYRQYAHTRDLMLGNPRMRAALLRGGIVWRLAYNAMSISDALDGPTGVPDLIIQDPKTKEYYRDDQLTTLEEDIIVGAYVCYSGRNAPVLKSWWPLAEVFDNGENPGRWTHHRETWYRNRLEAIIEGRERPYSVKQWRDKLHGRPETKKLRNYIEPVSSTFIDISCPSKLF
ncbi:hypothetical protein FA15DRAFT_601973, partial [Coprinopsis marcescibilis]